MIVRELFSDIPVLSISGDVEREVRAISYDSRTCGPGCVFCAVVGRAQDGHTFIPEAISRGSEVVVCERMVEVPRGVTVIRVADTREMLGKLGRKFYGDPASRLCLIGITGTNGKTTVTYLLEAIIRQAGFSPGVLGTRNYRYGGKVFSAPNTTPESLDLQRILHEMTREGVTHCIAEVSSHALALKRVDECDFDVGVFTNLSRDHLDFHQDMEDYFFAKRRLFAEILPRSTKGRSVTMIVNGDDPWGRRLAAEEWFTGWTFGREEIDILWMKDYKLSLRGITGVVRTPTLRFPLFSPLLGMFNLYNVLAAVATALALQIPVEAIVRGVEQVSHIPGRLERVSEYHQPHVVVDYAHTDDALHQVIATLLPFRERRLITIFGCGGDRDRGKRPRMGKVAAEGSDLVIITSDNPRTEQPLDIIHDIERGISCDIMRRVEPEELEVQAKAYTVIPDRRAAIQTAIGIAQKGDIVLIAGKGHEDYQIIGHEKVWFDDRVIAREFLEEKYYRGGA